MDAMIHAGPDAFAERKHHLVTTAALAVLFWAVAVLLVISADRAFPAPAVALALKVAAILAVAFACIRLTARETTLDEALFIGAGWMVLVILTEIGLTSHLHHTWCCLLGSSAHPALRYVLLAAWVGAPALFVTKSR
jgi:hypothetical protein